MRKTTFSPLFAFVVIIASLSAPAPLAAAPTLSWTLLHPAVSPSARSSMTMAYDADRHNVVMFGGTLELSDTWTWDGTAWAEQHPATVPIPTGGADLMVDDPARHKIVLVVADRLSIRTDTWTWDGTNWTKEQPTQAPPPRGGATLAYDAARQVVVLFGGCCDAAGHSLKDTWTWDGTSWTQQHPAIAPPDRANAVAVYDPLHQNVVVFGGHREPDAFGYTDTWTWDGTGWTEQHPATAPSPRENPSGTYDPLLPGVVLFGGNLSEGLSDMWDWDGRTWRQLQPGTLPPARATTSLAFDEQTQQIVLFGGYVSSCLQTTFCGPLADTWVFGPASTLPPAPRDARYFPQTGFRVDDDTIWNYFNRRGGLATFGYPVSRTFLFLGSPVQFFQRRIVQLDVNGRARLLNLLDGGLLPYSGFNGATFPASDDHLLATAPSPTDPIGILAYVRLVAVDAFQGQPVGFYQSFLNTVPAAVAFPTGGDANLLPGFDLEMWGIPTSTPQVDPNNHNFVYLRFQRGIMMYDATCTCTQGVLLADYLKSVLTGQNLPADLDHEAKASALYRQYDPNAPNWIHNTSLLPSSDLTNAFTIE